MDLEEAWTKEQELLNAQLQIARAVLDHRGEKGSSLEGYVRKFLRQCLPLQYGITTGFIALPPKELGGEPSISKQLDVIIYDAMISAPLISFPTCDVLPLEGVLGYVEVKANLKSRDELKGCVADAQAIRQHLNRWFWVATGANDARVLDCGETAARSYVFAFEGLSDPAAGLREAAKTLGRLAELSGFYVGNRGYYCSKPNESPAVVTVASGGDALTAFRLGIQHDLARARFITGTQVRVSDEFGASAVPIGMLSTPYLDHYAPGLLRKKLAEAHGL